VAECGSHAVVGVQLSRYDASEVHGAHRLLEQGGPAMLLLLDAGIPAGGFLEQARQGRAHALGALEAGAWENLTRQRRLSDGSGLAWVPPSRSGQAHYPRVAPALALLVLYHERWEIEWVIDEIKTHERAQRTVWRSKPPDGVVQELSGLFLAHYVVRWLLAQTAMETGLDPARLSLSDGLFYLVEMIDLTLTLEPEEATEPLLKRLHHQIARLVLPARRLRINRREVKQVSNKYKPKKRTVPPPKPFEPDEQCLDFVLFLDPLAPSRTEEVLT